MNLLGGALQCRHGAIGTTRSHFLRAQVGMEVVGTRTGPGIIS